MAWEKFSTTLETYQNIVKQVRTSQTGLLQVKAELHNKKRFIIGTKRLPDREQ